MLAGGSVHQAEGWELYNWKDKGEAEKETVKLDQLYIGVHRLSRRLKTQPEISPHFGAFVRCLSSEGPA